MRRYFSHVMLQISPWEELAWSYLGKLTAVRSRKERVHLPDSAGGLPGITQSQQDSEAISCFSVASAYACVTYWKIVTQ